VVGHGTRRDTVQGFVRVKSLENKSVKKYFAERERARADVGAGATRSGSPERKRVRFKTDAALEKFGRKAACITAPL